MCSVDITLIFKHIDEALDLGYNRLYVNVDDLENGYGFLRVLAMRGTRDLILFEGNFYILTLPLIPTFKAIGKLNQNSMITI